MSSGSSTTPSAGSEGRAEGAKAAEGNEDYGGSEGHDVRQGEETEQGRAYSADRVASRAYELYLARGGSDGQDFDDWLTAERELASRPTRGEGSE